MGALEYFLHVMHTIPTYRGISGFEFIYINNINIHHIAYLFCFPRLLTYSHMMRTAQSCLFLKEDLVCPDKTIFVFNVIMVVVCNTALGK